MSRQPMTAQMRNAILTSVGSEKAVAAMLGVSISTVGKTRRNNGVKPHGWADIVRTSALAVKLRKKGETYERIGKKLNIPTSTAFKWCIDAGLPKVKRPYRHAAPAAWVVKALKSAEAAK